MEDAAKPFAVTTAEFEAQVIDGEAPVILDFWAPWCGPCRAIAPILDQVAAEYTGRVRVAKINVDEQPELAAAFDVKGIPTVVGIHGREVVDVQVGFRGAAPLKKLAKRLDRRIKKSA